MATGPAARLVICAVCFLAATVVDAKGLPPVSPADFQDSERHGAADAADVTSYGVDALAYDVTIEMDVTATLDQRFDTKSIIRVKAKEATDVIVFNVKNIEVNQKVTVDERSTSFSVRIPVNGVEQDAAREQVAIYLDRPLVAGDEYDVTISGVGVEQNPSGRGLVRLNYDDNGRKSFMSAIRSSAKSGRTIFPCVDLPDVEADITLRVSRPSTHLAVSNARLSKSEAISSYFKDTFETVRLSPSQVGLVVAPTHSASSSLDGGVVSAYGRSEASAALREVATTIASLDVVVANLSGLPLALEQLTVVALPGATDVAANAGLLALDEVDVLSLTSGSPASARRDALLALSEAVGQPAVRAAALPRRWADAWAPRGLAAHLRHRYGDQVASGWRLAEQQMVLQLQDVLEEGARTTDTALPDRGSDVTQIGRAAVDKAAVLLRMLEVAFGSTRFGTAAQHYYKKSADGALEVDDLYDVFADEMYNEDLGGLPSTVPIVLSTWTSQPGYPVVTVVRDYENGKMTVSQKKFSWDASSESDAEGVQWWLPISWSYGEIAAYGLDAKPLYMDWMAPGENDVELEMPYVKSYDWIYFNLQQSGLYRVNYDVFNWLMLIKTLRSVRFDEVMAPTTRAHLLGDALALARAGELDYALALELATYVKQESDLVPWLAARRAFAFLEARLPKSSALKQLTAKLLRSRFLDAQFELDGSTSAPDASLLRELVVTWACQAGLQQCRDHAMELYRSWRVDNKAVKPDFVEATLCVGLAESDVDALPFLLELLARAETVGGIRRSLVRAARCAARQDVVQKLVQAAMDKDGAFLSSEVVQLLMAVTDDNPYGWDVVIEYLREGKNYNDLLARMGSPEDTKTLIFHLTSKISSQNELNQLVDAVRWLSTGEDASLLDSIKQTSAPQIAWLERYEDDINDWIRVYLETADNPTTTSPSTTSPSTTSPSTSTPTRAPTSTTSRAPTSTTSRATTSTPSRAPTTTSTRAPTSTTTTPRTNPPTTASSTSTSTPNYASTTETPSHASALKLPTTLTLLLLVTACRHWF